MIDKKIYFSLGLMAIILGPMGMTVCGISGSVFGFWVGVWNLAMGSFLIGYNRKG